MDLKITLPGEEGKARKAYRAEIPGLAVVLSPGKERLPLKDLSYSGFAAEDTGQILAADTEQKADLVIRNKLVLVGVTIKVVRIIKPGLVGCIFLNLNHQEETRLDKLILEVQKRRIAHTKEEDQE